MVFFLENLSNMAPLNMGTIICGKVNTMIYMAKKRAEEVKSNIIRLMAKPERELPIMDTTLPKVIIVKSLVQRGLGLCILFFFIGQTLTL